MNRRTREAADLASKLDTLERHASRADGMTAVERALTEGSKDVWARWSHDRELRQLQRKAHAELAAREAANLPIYPRECALRIAEDTRASAPDWRFIRDTLGPAWMRLLRAQPELAPAMTKQREATITAIFNSVPSHLQASINDLRTLIELMLIAHECAAYLVGFEGGKLRAHEREDAHGRTHRTPSRRAAREGAETSLRLTLEEGGAR